MSKLEERLKAEAYFLAVWEGKKSLPADNESSEYGKLILHEWHLSNAYNHLKEMNFNDAKLRAARRHGFLRPKREDLKNEILPIKEGVKTAEQRINSLIKAINDIDHYAIICKTINAYDLEMAYRTLQAYNSIIDLEFSLCIKTGSLTEVAEYL